MMMWKKFVHNIEKIIFDNLICNNFIENLNFNIASID